MKLSRRREIVLEIETVRTVRKRAVTHVILCPECRRETDFLELGQASKLFDTPVDELLSFVNANRCHHTVAPDGDIHICLAQLLSAVKRRTEIPDIRLIGGLNT